ncbi:MAG TPA: polyprenyl synthetase family protein [Candidatus Baltobacteraceae bacterium]|nr:polyprenyl synthetase family protein [Candidatus Baltobacteraceae bacterium]
MLLYHFGYGKYGPARAGKRLRPQIVMRTALAHERQLQAALDAAAAIELLHNYSLVHDDIEDRDELRHGRKTLWSRYGVPQAINTGDAMCAQSFLALARASDHHPADRVLAMIATLHRAHRVMCDGQSLDLEFENATYVDLPAYERMIACKTAALFEAAFVLGAHCAQLDPEATARYARVGHAYGMAFQIRDDISGIWGSAESTGKTSGNDLARRKWTYPVVWAIGQPESAAREVVAKAYAGGGGLDARAVAFVGDALETLGAQEAAARAIAEPMAVVKGLPDQALREYLLETLAAPLG